MGSNRTIPANYPQPLGNQLQKADAFRQASMLRQEMVTDLLAVLSEAREPGVRQRLIRLVESHLKAGMTAAQRAEDLWPTEEEAGQMIAAKPDLKPAAAKKHLKVFQQWNKVQHRSLELLESSFENISLILARLRPPEPIAETPKPGVKPLRTQAGG
ncbi:MAG: hypothetical protein U1G07_08700 [Verrucomicrobiota bacterium]